jgi:hypothetical protein
VKWACPDDIRDIAQRLNSYGHATRVRARRARAKRQRHRDLNTESVRESTVGGRDDTIDQGFPEPLVNAWARLLQEWHQWDDAERLVYAFELAANLIIENTKPGRPYLLEYAPPALHGSDLSANYLRVGAARHEGLGLYDFDIRNSSIRSPGGNWLPARILGGIGLEAQGTAAVRLASAENDEAATAAWATRLAKPFRERDLFGQVEIAEHLTWKSVLEPDDAKRDRILLDLDEWTSRGHFNLSGESELVIKIPKPPYFRVIGPNDIIDVPSEFEGLRVHNAQFLYLRRPACRRYIEANLSLENTPRLLREWFPEPIAVGEKSSTDDKDEPNSYLQAPTGPQERRPGLGPQRVAYRGPLEAWMAQQELPVLRRMGPAAIAPAFKSHCEQHLPELVPLLPKRLRSMENVIERIIKRRIDAVRTKPRGTNPAGNGQ